MHKPSVHSTAGMRWNQKLKKKKIYATTLTFQSHIAFNLQTKTTRVSILKCGDVVRPLATLFRVKMKKN